MSRQKEAASLASGGPGRRSSIQQQQLLIDSSINASHLNASGKLSGENTPLLSSVGVGPESLVNASVVTAAELQTGVSWGMAAFLLVNTALGAGMLNYPYAYNQIGGVWAAALMQSVLLVFITSTMFILVYCADFNRDSTFHDVLLSMCGKRAQQISALSILLTCYGINITFLVIIGDQYDRIFNSLLASDDLDWFMDRKFTIFLTAVLFILPMCYAQRLDFLRHASVLGMFAMLYVAFLTVYEHYQLDEATIAAMSVSLQQTGGHGASRAPPAQVAPNSSASRIPVAPAGGSPGAPKHIHWFEPLAIVPVLCFAYQTHEVIVPVYSCMRQRFIGNFMKASIFGLVILFLLYNLVGAFGYLTFGEQVGADIMSLYDAKDPVVVVGIVALVVKFVTTYPPLMFCGRSALDGLYGEIRKLPPAEFQSGERARRYVITTVWFASSVAIAVFAPDISVTLQLLGSMASINVFVFPGMCLVSLTRRLRRARRAILMGELPDGCADAAWHKRRQRAKDYYLISGSYFGAAMKKNQAAALHTANSGTCCNPHCLAANSGSTNPKHFTATFASLLEFENNVTADGTAALTARDPTRGLLDRPHSNLPLNSRGCDSGGVGEILSSFSTPSNSSSSSSSAILIEKQNLLNGFGGGGGRSESSAVSQSAQQTQRQIQRRQEEFERLMTSTSFCDNCCCCCSNSSLAINNSLAREQPHHQEAAKHNPMSYGKRINDPYDGYSGAIDRANHNNRHHPDELERRNQNCIQHNDSAAMISHQSQLKAPTMTRDESSAHNQLKADQFADNPPGVGLFHAARDPSARHYYQQQNQFLHSNSLNNYCQLSATGSLLDKLGTSIAPSTVAQIGISRCTALGLYAYSGLLIFFGTFIFILELVTVFGIL